MFHYLTANKKLFVFYLILVVVGSLMGIVFPFILSEIINCAVRADFQFLWKLLVFGVLFLAVSVSISYVYNVICNKIITNARFNIKKDMFQVILKKNVLDYEFKDSADYLSDFLQNLDMFENLYFNNMLGIPMTMLSLLAAVITSIYLEPLMLIIIVALGVVTAVVVIKMAKRLEKVTANYSKSLRDYTGEIQNDFQSFRIIKTYAIEDELALKHSKQNRATELAKKRSLDERVAFGRINEFAGVTTTLLIMGAAAFFAMRGSFSAGIVIGFGQLAGKIIGPIMSSSDIVVSVKSAKSLKEKYMKITKDNQHGTGSDQPASRMIPIKGAKPATYGDIIVKNLSFSYVDKTQPGKTLFNGLNYEFRKGKSHLILGGNGSGKSTLLMILMGQYGAGFEGEVQYNGQNLLSLDTSTIPDIVSYVSQSANLLNDTLRNNITLYREYPEEKILEVLEKCGLTELIASLPDGLDTLVKEGGANFSGGERQKLNLAKALLRDTPVLILDEISANLDKESTEQIENIVLDSKEKMIISVAHKLPEEIAKRYDYTLQL